MNNKLLKKLGKSAFRIVAALAVILGIPAIAYLLWQPGSNEPLPEYANNAIWLGHGWMGDDGWFERNNRNKDNFRRVEKISALFKKLSDNKISTVYPHLCPAELNGKIASYDSVQVELFLDIAAQYNIKVIPWIGGVFEESARPANEKWRQNFVASVDELFKKHPRLAGVQVNIEPMPSGNTDFLILLDDLKIITHGRILSVAAYPPPTVWHRFPSVHWDLTYLSEVGKRTDQMAVMMYDTAIPYRKFYINLYKLWISDLIYALSPTFTEILLGVPAYEDAGVGYHYPEAENLNAALSAISASPFKKNVSGVAIYCEWEMDENKWQLWRKFIR